MFANGSISTAPCCTAKQLVRCLLTNEPECPHHRLLTNEPERLLVRVRPRAWRPNHGQYGGTGDVEDDDGGGAHATHPV